MSYRLLGPPPWARSDHEPGVVELIEHRCEDRTRQISATRIDRFTLIDSGMLAWVREGSVLGASFTGDRLTLTLHNGTWTYQLGEHDDRYDAFTLRLVDGNPMTPNAD